MISGRVCLRANSVHLSEMPFEIAERLEVKLGDRICIRNLPFRCGSPTFEYLFVGNCCGVGADGLIPACRQLPLTRRRWRGGMRLFFEQPTTKLQLSKGFEGCKNDGVSAASLL